MNQNLVEWIHRNKLNVEKITTNIISINEMVFLIVEPKHVELSEDKTQLQLFDDEMSLLLDEEEQLNLEHYNCTHYLFPFGDFWMYHPITTYHIIKAPEVFKYLGVAVSEYDDWNYVHLGLHGGYEILNGVGVYEDWIKKARFYNMNALAICEKHTLAGTLSFQFDCKDKQVKSIIGETISVEVLPDQIYDFKFYVTNQEGWQSLLQLNKIINVDLIDTPDRYVSFLQLLQNSSGLIAVVPVNCRLTTKLIKSLKSSNFVEVFYQVDISEYTSQVKEQQVLETLQYNIHNFIGTIDMVYIQDTYYLDPEHWNIKKYLNTLSGKKSFGSKDQYFKNIDDILVQISEILPPQNFKNGWSDYELVEHLITNTSHIAELCNFQIETKSLKLPKYHFSHAGLTGFALFEFLIYEGLKNKNIPKASLKSYKERIEKEVDVIDRGGFIDYFLILWDVGKWCTENNIYRGLGRGSAGGSLVAYLLNITQIDPMKYDLLFERFLNESRIKSGLPDIDIDYQGERREEVKRYMEKRFGVQNVCSIGTYTTFKIKAAFKDFGRVLGANHTLINVINKMLVEDDYSWFDIFKFAKQTQSTSGNSTLLNFLNHNYKLLHTIYPALHQPKSSSIHAAGIIITPEVNEQGQPMDIFKWMPIKKMDGVLVSEWEGTYLDKAGFLKEDTLGIKQLDKFAAILQLIKDTEGDEVDIYNLPLDDEEVFNYFKRGWNEDVFQLGAAGLRAYCQDLKPGVIDDLIATVALYRPGPIGMNYHNKYVLIKNGKAEPEYFWGTEEILKPTYSLMVFQEQIIQMVQDLAGFTLVEADNIRRAIGKKDKELMASYEEQFVSGCVSKGCDSEEAKDIWIAINEFAGYSFNKSHSAAYAITGYICQWLKVHYPLQFWTIALQFANEDELVGRMIELSKSSTKVKLLPPDINESNHIFKLNYKANRIYWSLSKIKQLGPVAMDYLIAFREKNSQFYSFEDFYKAIAKNKIKKNLIVNLILSGCFDQIENVTDIRERYKILQQLAELSKDPKILDVIPTHSKNKVFYWNLLQQQICGYGDFNFENILKESAKFKDTKLYVDPIYLYRDREEIERKQVVVGGILSTISTNNTKNGEMGRLQLLNDNELIPITMWPDSWAYYKHTLQKAKGGVIYFKGIVKYDGWKKRNVIYSNDETVIDVL